MAAAATKTPQEILVEGKDPTVPAPEEVEIASTRAIYQFATGFDYALMVVGTFAACIVGIGQPFMMVLFGEMINGTGSSTISKSEQRDNFNQIGINFALLAVVTFVFGWMYATCFKIVGYRQGAVWRRVYLSSILRQDVEWFDVNNPNELPSFITETTANIEAGVSSKLGDGIRFGAQGLAGFAFSFLYKWDLALVMTALSPIAMLGSWFLGHVTKTTSVVIESAYTKAGAIASETFSSVRTVAALQGEAKAVQGYTSHLDVAMAAGISRGWKAGFGSGVLVTSGNMMTALGIIYAAYTMAKELDDSEEVLADGVTKINCMSTFSCDTKGGDILTTLFALQMGAQGLGLVEPAMTAFTKARASAHSVLKTVNRVPAISQASGGEKLDQVTGKVVFKDVRFTYPSRPDQPVLRGFNLEVEAGTTVALVGSSGCGKSTSIQLLERFYDPMEGTVTLDGKDLKSLDLRWLRSQIGLVSQEPVLFSGTIAENIAYGKPGATREEVIEAAKMANAHDFIMGFGNTGYDTDVGASGGQLSGGQKQRIAISRAMMKDPSVLLLDEATSALDNESERVVQAALDDLLKKKNRTTLVIAHRLTTIRNADKIVVVDKGVVVEQGNHDTLMGLGQGGHYYALVKAAEAAPSTPHPSDSNNQGWGLAQELLGKGAQYTKSESSEDSQQQPKKRGRAGSIAEGESSTSDRLASLIPFGSVATELHVEAAMDKQAKKEETKAKKKEKKKEAKELTKRVWRYHEKGDRKYFLIGGVGGLIGGAVNPFMGYMLTQFIFVFFAESPDRMRYEGRLYGAAVVFIGIAQIIGGTMRGYGFAVTGERLTRKLRRLVFGCIVRQDMSWFDLPENGAGILASNLAADVKMVQALSGEALGQQVFFASAVVSGFTVAFGLGSYLMALIAMALLPVIGVGIAIQIAIMSGGESGGASQSLGAKASAIVAEAVASIRTVASFNLEEKLNRDFGVSLDRHLEAATGSSVKKGFFTGFSRLTTYGTLGLMYWLGGILVVEGYMDFDEMIVSIFAVFMMAVGASLGSQGATDAGEALAASKRMFELLDRKSLIDVDVSTAQGKTPSEAVRGEIQFSNVRFAYPTRLEQPVLRGFNLRVEAGTTVALVGSSGCGKSTSIQLLERFYDPHQGTVTLDGVDLKELSLGWLRSQIGLVSQEPVLFSGTIAENIAYGKPGATREEVIEAAKMANAHDFIMGFEGTGYDTDVGKSGGQLSGGQKQRIAIARAMMKDPSVLLLDEATSALDNESERVVQAALDDLLKKKKRTTLVIAHRLTTIRNADKIVVVDKGKVVEEGTHDSLMAKGEGGRYYELAKKLKS